MQIELAPKHRDFGCFLWLKSIENFDAENFENNEIREFRVCRVSFVLKPSPFLLVATLIKLIMSYAVENPKSVKKMLESFHADDLNQIIFDFTEIRAKLIDHPTRRQLLQSIASIYDPPNLINPVIVKMKKLSQDVCAAKI